MMPNITIIMDFLLMGFSDQREFQFLHFVVFLLMYLAILIGNLLLIILVVMNNHLQKPMYFFLVNLAIVDLGSTSVTIPRSMASALMNTRKISYSECAVQMFFFVFFLSSDFFLLTAMAYDRYVAICHPLHYMSVMKWGSCFQMAGSAWMLGFLNAAMHAGTLFSLPFCSTVIHQFLCEIPHLMKISCFDPKFSEIHVLLFSSLLCGVFFILIVMSYVKIFKTILSMSSVASRQKAFSTCIPHLLVVCLLCGTGMFSQFISNSASSYNWDVVLAVIYSVIPPMMNPVIYSMRNKDIKAALWMMFNQRITNQNTEPA
ncbi:olfactory receptor 14I1-like [Protobothrops mucrosquamatus]|uniref:olfactory receptor 14I1-like n=1 Tax=Protobothrops mucrosquamatus TaxID=103944 RepID=UPI0010FB654E|nr:olfactory receptor 14I1-like [Protobothrops mucrosquamatus]